jgi:hypothetical protein
LPPTVTSPRPLSDTEPDAASVRHRGRQQQEPRGRKLATFQKHTLYEHAIVTTNGEANLDGVHAEVDTAGNLTTKSRATLTRMAAGGLLLGPLGSILSLASMFHRFRGGAPRAGDGAGGGRL